ncbi:MAG: GTPase domain-containing protein [Planctomycetaceae bacterium]
MRGRGPAFVVRITVDPPHPQDVIVPPAAANAVTEATTPFRRCADGVRMLRAALLELERVARAAQVPPLAGREWYELIARKLLPQLTDDSYLVVAVVGGTNIGKSVVFNHIAGARASATSPLASGTKHPTLLVRGEFVDTHDLEQIFPGFELQPWTQAEEALREEGAHQLFWRVSAATPENLLVLDTPDIDSDARINWERADSIRRCADVLIAVLTQQKYNDAAVKEFFRKAAREDKEVLILFNQCQLPEDEEYWPLWVDTFCRETGIEPSLVYVAPSDRAAAEANRLPFYEREWPRQKDASGKFITSSESNEPRSLLQDLSEMRFAEIKLRTLRGSLVEVLDGERGLPAYLGEARRCSGDFKAAAELLAAHQLAEIDNWPAAPNKVLVGELREWWSKQREGWSATVHGFYNAIGRGLAWPIKAARETIYGEEPGPFDRYRELEWAAILTAVEKVFRKLTWISELGNELLRPKLQSLLAGANRSQLLDTLQAAHRQVDLKWELSDLVAREMQSFRDESPKYYEFFRRLDGVAAAARPATSVVLFLTGFGPVGDVLMPAVADGAIQGMVHIAGDVAGGTVAAAVGESVISGTASQGAGYLEAKFRRLHNAFTARRAAWLGGLLKEHLLRDLPEELATAAMLPESPEWQRVEQLQQQLASQLPKAGSGTN